MSGWDLGVNGFAVPQCAVMSLFKSSFQPVMVGLCVLCGERLSDHLSEMQTLYPQIQKHHSQSAALMVLDDLLLSPMCLFVKFYITNLSHCGAFILQNLLSMKETPAFHIERQCIQLEILKIVPIPLLHEVMLYLVEIVLFPRIE